MLFFFFSSRRRHTRSDRDWSSDVCSSDLYDQSRLNLRRNDIEGQKDLFVGLAFQVAKTCLHDTMIFWKQTVRMQVHKRLNSKNLAPRARFELATLRLTAECSTVELPGNRSTYLFSF